MALWFGIMSKFKVSGGNMTYGWEARHLSRETVAAMLPGRKATLAAGGRSGANSRQPKAIWS